MNTKLTTATGNAVLRAYNRAAKNTDRDSQILASASSAGFIIPAGQKRGHRKGYQVFVRLVRFDEELLKSKPITGGLLCE